MMATEMLVISFTGGRIIFLCQLNFSVLHFQRCNVHACSQMMFVIHFQKKLKVH